LARKVISTSFEEVDHGKVYSDDIRLGNGLVLEWRITASGCGRRFAVSGVGDPWPARAADEGTRRRASMARPLGRARRWIISTLLIAMVEKKPEHQRMRNWPTSLKPKTGKVAHPAVDLAAACQGRSHIKKTADAGMRTR